MRMLQLWIVTELRSTYEEFIATATDVTLPEAALMAKRAWGRSGSKIAGITKGKKVKHLCFSDLAADEDNLRSSDGA